MTTTLLAIQHAAESGPRRLGDWLAADGVHIDVIHGYRGDEVPKRLEHDGLIVLGGGFMPDADDRAPWLAPTRRLVEQAVSDGTPMLGICLGGQMLAHVAGGSVKADAGAPENGSTPIRFRAEAADDPLFGVVDGVVPAIEHHVDAITALPSGAVWLAETDRCPYQAFRVGAAAWGIQFHPEIAAERILSWGVEGLAKHGLDRDVLHREAMEAEPRAIEAWRAVAARFAEIIHSRRNGAEPAGA